jgi:pimeloyl-ACP methyl ester carboxylesterase
LKPLFFGPDNHKLYGVYHEASEFNLNPKGILICSSIGHEYIRGYRIIRMFAERLANEGNHVLRYDPFGHGDSSGSCAQVNTSLLIEDIQHSIDELSKLTGLNSISIVGLRLGAVFAWNAMNKISNIDSLVMWDPVVNGKQWLHTLKAQHCLYTNSINTVQDSSNEEYLGYHYSMQFQNELTLIDLQFETLPPRKNIAVFYSDTSLNVANFVRQYQTFDNVFFAKNIVSPDVWNIPNDFSKIIMNCSYIPALTEYFQCNATQGKSL